jgi:hypothetical protein
MTKPSGDTRRVRAIAVVLVGSLAVTACSYPQPARVRDDSGPGSDVMLDGPVDTMVAMVDARPDGPAAPADHVARCAMDDNPADGTPTCTGATATCSACPAATTGYIGGGYMFTAASSHFVDLDPDTLLGPTFTVSIWVRPGASTGFVTAFGVAISAASSRNVASIMVGPSPNHAWFESTEAGNGDFLSGGPDLRDGMWHHVAITWNGSIKRLYVDGTQVATETTPLTTGGGPTSFGADYDANVATNFYPGALDELRIYSRALSAAEVATLAAQ